MAGVAVSAKIRKKPTLYGDKMNCTIWIKDVEVIFPEDINAPFEPPAGYAWLCSSDGFLLKSADFKFIGVAL